MIEIILLSAVVGTVSMTITRSRLFMWLPRMCPYCFGHWVAIPLVVIYQPRVLASDLFFIDVVCNWFAVIAFASIWQFIIGVLFFGMVVSKSD